MITVMLILAVAALICSILTLMGKLNAGVPLILLSIIACISQIPLGR